MQPSARGNAVGDIREAVSSENLDKVFENRSLNEIRMELGDSIDLVGTNNGQVSHADHLRARLLDDGDAGKQLALLWELTLHSLEEEKVDIINDLQMSWQEVLEQWNRPLLERLGENSVVSVAECLGNDSPGSLPLETFEINQDALQLNNGKSWVRVIQLDSDLVREFLPGTLTLLESSYDIIQ